MMSHAEIDALAVPAGWTAGPRPIDDSYASSGLIAIYGEARGREMHHEHHERMATRMAEAAGRRYGWTAAQVAAAVEVYPHIPIHAKRSGRMSGTDTLAVLIEAARRAAPTTQLRLAL